MRHVSDSSGGCGTSIVILLSSAFWESIQNLTGGRLRDLFHFDRLAFTCQLARARSNDVHPETAGETAYNAAITIASGNHMHFIACASI